MTNPQDTIARLRIRLGEALRLDYGRATDRDWSALLAIACDLEVALGDAEAALSVPNHSSVGREELARIIDPDAWHEKLPTDGLAQHWHARRKKALAKADAILALLRSVPAGVSEDGIAIVPMSFVQGVIDDFRGRAATSRNNLDGYSQSAWMWEAAADVLEKRTMVKARSRDLTVQRRRVWNDELKIFEHVEGNTGSKEPEQ